MNKEKTFYVSSLILFVASMALFFFTNVDDRLFILPVVFIIAAALLFIVPALLSLEKEARKKYIVAYTIFGIIFAGGVVTIFLIIFSLASIGIFTAATAHLLTEKLNSGKARMIFYTASLGASSVYLTMNLIEFISAMPIQTDEIMRVVFGLVLGGVIFLGLLTAFIVRAVSWRNERKYGGGKVSGVNR